MWNASRFCASFFPKRFFSVPDRQPSACYYPQDDYQKPFGKRAKEHPRLVSLFKKENSFLFFLYHHFLFSCLSLGLKLPAHLGHCTGHGIKAVNPFLQHFISITESPCELFKFEKRTLITLLWTCDDLWRKFELVTVTSMTR